MAVSTVARAGAERRRPRPARRPSPRPRFGTRSGRAPPSGTKLRRDGRAYDTAYVAAVGPPADVTPSRRGRSCPTTMCHRSSPSSAHPAPTRPTSSSMRRGRRPTSIGRAKRDVTTRASPASAGDHRHPPSEAPAAPDRPASPIRLPPLWSPLPAGPRPSPHRRRPGIPPHRPPRQRRPPHSTGRGGPPASPGCPRRPTAVAGAGTGTGTGTGDVHIGSIRVEVVPPPEPPSPAPPGRVAPSARRSSRSPAAHRPLRMAPAVKPMTMGALDLSIVTARVIDELNTAKGQTQIWGKSGREVRHRFQRRAPAPDRAQTTSAASASISST